MKKINETDLAMIINNRTMIDYLDRLRMLATSLFTWKGIDDVAGAYVVEADVCHIIVFVFHF